jgi:hypothetical protein
MFFCRHYFSPLNTFIIKGKDPEPDPDPEHCLLLTKCVASVPPCINYLFVTDHFSFLGCIRTLIINPVSTRIREPDMAETVEEKVSEK